MAYKTKILATQFVTHDTKRFLLSRPSAFQWQPGQGVELVIDEAPWDQEDGRPFTPTGQGHDQVLEFIIKRYAEHQGVTDHLHTLAPGSQLLMSKPFGAIGYKGKGVFIAAGAGITPFLGIFRQLAAEDELAGNSLLYANKTPADVICQQELEFYFGEKAIFTCTRGNFSGYGQGHIDKEFLTRHVADFDRYFYVCGPKAFVKDISAALTELGAGSQSLVYDD
ncbi:MAG: flavodoxin reductase [Desulfobulbaceae bacterium]|nr:MAG: flavodoxin reductase [Desulfobulbaceae bacterium]